MDASIVKLYCEIVISDAITRRVNLEMTLFQQFKSTSYIHKPANVKFPHLDVDECGVPDACLSGQTCTNTIGSFKCEHMPCGEGFERNLITGVCDDIDECDRDYCGGGAGMETFIYIICH